MSATDVTAGGSAAIREFEARPRPPLRRVEQPQRLTEELRAAFRSLRK
jgi:hypothetical protein